MQTDDKASPVEGKKRFCWLEEYQGCGCSFVGRTKRDMPGYCARHGSSAIRAPMKIPQGMPLGHAG